MEKDATKDKILEKRKQQLAGKLQAELGKIPPQALDLEEAVLGALMLEKNAILAVNEIVNENSFYKSENAKIYKAIIDLNQQHKPIDLLTVAQELRTKGELELVGGAFYLTQLTSRVNSAANIEFHARIIAEAAIKRELISYSNMILHDAFEDKTDVFELLDRAEQMIFKVVESNIKKNFEDLSSLLGKAIKDLENKKTNNTGVTGVPSGFSALDKMTSGWQKSDLVIVAARPGMGKTAFSLTTVRNAAVDFGIPVAFFSLEMSSLQLVNRLLSGEAELESDKIKRGTLHDYEWSQLHAKIKKLESAKIFIDDTPALSIRDFRSKARRLKHEHNVQLIVVDYLQLMTAGSDLKGSGIREQEIGIISRSLKGVAKELDIPIIALAQLSRAVESRTGEKKPQLSDLRESGSIEQDADMVMFLYRPEYYKLTEMRDEDNNVISTEGLGEVIVAKHRNGELGSVYLKFIGKYTKFIDYEGYGLSPNIQPLPSRMNHDSNFNDSASDNVPPMRYPSPFDDEGAPF